LAGFQVTLIGRIWVTPEVLCCDAFAFRIPLLRNDGEIVEAILCFEHPLDCMILVNCKRIGLLSVDASVSDRANVKFEATSLVADPYQ